MSLTLGEARALATGLLAAAGLPVDHARTTADLIGRDFNAVLGAVLPAGRKAVVMGHSMGGMTLISWAGRYPEKVTERAAAVLLTNTGAHSLVEVSTMVPGLNKPLRLLRGRAMPTPTWLGRLILGTPVVFPPIKPVRWIFEYDEGVDPLGPSRFPRRRHRLRNPGTAPPQVVDHLGRGETEREADQRDRGVAEIGQLGLPLVVVLPDRLGQRDAEPLGGRLQGVAVGPEPGRIDRHRRGHEQVDPERHPVRPHPLHLLAQGGRGLVPAREEPEPAGLCGGEHQFGGAHPTRHGSGQHG